LNPDYQEEEMDYKIEVYELVYQQVAEMINYYDTLSPELGFTFELESRLLLRKLTKRPLSYFNLDKRHRRISFQKFPYMFVFEVIEKTVLLKLLYPQKGDPAGLVNRLKMG
jgi:hypothetical protein